MSPNGSKVAFVVNNDLYFKLTTAGVSPVRLTCQGEQKGFSCGIADYVAQEKMSRYEGFWWSPNSESILYTINDESFIPEYQILHQGKSNLEHNETHRYPFAGEQNPFVRLQVLKVPTSTDEKLQALDLPVIDERDERFATVTPAPGQTKEYYIARAGWWKDGSVMVQVTNHAQTYLQLLLIDPITGTRTVILEEKTDVWINLHDMLHMLPKGYQHLKDTDYQSGDFYFLWASERSGFMQVYMCKYAASTSQTTCMHGGSCLGNEDGWVVEGIQAVDTSNGWVFLSGNYSDFMEHHLVRVNMHTNEGGVQKLIRTAGWQDTHCAENVDTVYMPPGFYLKDYLNSGNGLPKFPAIMSVYGDHT